MMLRIGLRFHRTGMMATAAIAGLNGILQSLGFKAIVGNSEAARQQFGLQMQLLGRQVSYLVPLPVHPETLAGYVQWRVFGFFPLIFGFWALMAGSGVIRGDEERGLLELWLANRISRSRLTAARSGAFVIAVGGAIVVACVLTAFGANAAASPLPIDGLLANGAALLALTAACFGIALLIAQFADSRRVAAGVGAIVLLGLFLLNSFGRTLDELARVRGISPFFYYDRVNGLSPGGHVDWVSTLDLVVAALVLIVLAGFAFARRDLGSGLVRRRPVERPPVTEASRNPLLRLPVLAAIYEQRYPNATFVITGHLGFAKDNEGRWRKIVQSGPAVLEDDVEVQANACVDRASIGETRVGKGTRIDNLVQVGHGSRVGNNTLLCAQVGLAGSTEVGDNVILAGQVGVAGHCKIGDGVIATAQSGIPNDVAAGKVVSGYPAIDNKLWLRCVAVFNRLPELLKRVRGRE